MKLKATLTTPWALAKTLGLYKRHALLHLGMAIFAVLTAAAIFSFNPSTSTAAADRFGGIWHQGASLSPMSFIFLPKSWANVLKLREDFQSLSASIIDIEVIPKGCPSDEKDEFALLLGDGAPDELVVFSSLEDFEAGIVNQCEAGFQCVDFEIWNSSCEGESQKYIALFRKTVQCSVDPPPLIDSTWLTSLNGMINQKAQTGYTLGDFEIDKTPMQQPFPQPVHAMGVWYGGSSDQEFLVLERQDFEEEMLSREGLMTLMDMESERLKLYPGKSPTRYVAALWEVLPGKNTDDHELGEVPRKFNKLHNLNYLGRKLVDFEIYPNTNDSRFSSAIFKHLTSVTNVGGHSFAVRQGGDVVASGARGWARFPHTNGLSDFGMKMKAETRGPVLSVTKFFTALGVLRYAETQPDIDNWLNEPFIHHLPNDFNSFGSGVDTVTIRDLLSQRTGLAPFMPSPSAGNKLLAGNPTEWRQALIAWLTQPLANFVKPYKYQNVHFELLALIMDEVELPQIMGSPTPWHDWMNQEVFAPAGVGPLLCGGTDADALSYPAIAPPSSSKMGVKFADGNWSCAGYGTGVAMFWASSLDLAKVSEATFRGSILSQSTVAQIKDQALGLDWPNPDDDGSFSTVGEELYHKNGGICTGNASGEPSGSETVIASYDDFNFDDDITSITGGPFGNNLNWTDNDYVYERGYRDFNVGVMVHSAPSSVECPDKDTTRNFPTPKEMLKEALRLPENW